MYWITGVVGLFMILAPFLFQYSTNTGALWTSLLAGGVVAIASYVEAMQHDKADWEYWIAGIVGIFAIVAPFLFGFTAHAAATWTSVLAGGVIAFLAGSRLWLGKPI